MLMIVSYLSLQLHFTHMKHHQNCLNRRLKNVPGVIIFKLTCFFFLQLAHETLVRFGSTDLQALLQITGEGGAWSSPILTSLLTGQPTNTEEGQFVLLITSLSLISQEFFIILSFPFSFPLTSWRLHQLGGRGLHGDASETPGEDGRTSQGSGVGKSLHRMLLRLQPGHLSSNLRLTALPPPSKRGGHHGGMTEPVIVET